MILAGFGGNVIAHGESSQVNQRMYMIFGSTDLIATSARCATLEFRIILRGDIVVQTTLRVKQEF